DEHISVSGVGFDIACGNMAVKLDVPKKAIEDRIEPILQDIAANVSFGLGRANKEKVEHQVFDSPLWQKSHVVGRFKSMGREQLGTVGSGNHTRPCTAPAGSCRAPKRAAVSSRIRQPASGYANQAACVTTRCRRGCAARACASSAAASMRHRKLIVGCLTCSRITPAP